MLYLLTLSRYSLFQNSLKRVLQSLNPDPKFRAIPRVIFGIPPPKHTFNPESCFDFAFKSRIPSFKSVKDILVTEKPYWAPSLKYGSSRRSSALILTAELILLSRGKL